MIRRLAPAKAGFGGLAPAAAAGFFVAEGMMIYGRCVTLVFVQKWLRTMLDAAALTRLWGKDQANSNTTQLTRHNTHAHTHTHKHKTRKMTRAVNMHARAVNMLCSACFALRG